MKDGTIQIKVKTKEVIYFEHFGRMGDEGYRKDTREIRLLLL